jgi:hypothetical protein
VWRLRLEGTALGEVTGVSLAYGVGFRLGYRLSERFALGVALAGPLVGGTYRASTGTASVHQELGALEVLVTAYASERFRFGAALGGGVYHLTARSEVKPPYASKSDDVLSALGSAGVFTDLYLTETIAVSAAFSALGVTPRPGVAVGPEQVVFSEPLFWASLGMGVDF